MTQDLGDPEGADEDFVTKLTLCQPALQVYVVGLTPCRGDADDVLQEVNLALWRKRSQYKRDQDFNAWAFGFAILELRNFRSRSAKSRLWFSDTTIQELAVDWPQEATFAQDRRDALAGCLMRLGEYDRAVVAAFYGRGARAEEIAVETGAPPSRIYRTLTRIRSLLRDCVRRSLSQYSRGEGVT
ncbi:sigma-70 family RNA polymerase sigma factor [Lacipirellula sp.]|uniref:sigma-70 family RNA polymerase sigma factor n=1 Tax=Lacipirellula sp. TaxID=2691419 RepID=UPI003D0C5248